MEPKKTLGQNFLIDDEALDFIASLIDISKDDAVVEVGPGHGELTIKLLKAEPMSLTVIEKDRDLWSRLKTKFDRFPAFSLKGGDALEELPKIAPKNSDWKIVGNIPYYITGHLLRIIGELDNPPRLSVFTVQKEVAERASALPPDMNLLSASLGFWSDIMMAGVINRTSFDPVPNVDSAVIVISKKDRPNIPADDYYRAMKTIFKQPRKTVVNNLMDGLSISREEAERKMSAASLSLRLRPQDLSVDDIVKLSR
ncbi:MAG: 16S rRNA (adenine(1518)-N(6)/adenine(1519)-N(6))-dimethyltransferase RsmA [Candidatus Colwellbacteria bacterium]|nr:16S rRNA (adenine(1518)-N(6)/adenine(1519)-N(6))-dimethyltransferase RsmA [Candidatus Colwellbacteria bacterium]